MGHLQHRFERSVNEEDLLPLSSAVERILKILRMAWFTDKEENGLGNQSNKLSRNLNVVKT